MHNIVLIERSHEENKKIISYILRLYNYYLLLLKIEISKFFTIISIYRRAMTEEKCCKKLEMQKTQRLIKMPMKIVDKTFNHYSLSTSSSLVCTHGNQKMLHGKINPFKWNNCHVLSESFGIEWVFGGIKVIWKWRRKYIEKFCRLFFLLSCLFLKILNFLKLFTLFIQFPQLAR